MKVIIIREEKPRKLTVELQETGDLSDEVIAMTISDITSAVVSGVYNENN